MLKLSSIIDLNAVKRFNSSYYSQLTFTLKKIDALILRDNAGTVKFLRKFNYKYSNLSKSVSKLPHLVSDPRKYLMSLTAILDSLDEILLYLNRNKLM